MAYDDQKPIYSSSSEDEEASVSEDEQTSGSESEQEASDSTSNDKPPKKPLISPPKSAIKPQDPDLCSSESEESGSGTDSDLPVQKPAVEIKIKPIVSKPVEREELKPAPSPASKRLLIAPVANEKDLKKAKKNMVTTDDDSKKQLFQRLWSEDDEIVILKGMIDYKAENGENLIADMGAFHEFIKKSLHVDVSRAQLVDKIRRLKKKFVNNVSREKNGKDRSFSKSHEQKGYELSKLIWGGGSHSGVTEGKKNTSQKNGNAASTSGGTAANMMKSNGLDDKEGLVTVLEKEMNISRFVRYGGLDECPVLTEEIVKAGIDLVDGSKRVELEERWRSLKKQELELYLKKMDFIKEQALVVLEAVNLSGN